MLRVGSRVETIDGAFGTVSSFGHPDRGRIWVELDNNAGFVCNFRISELMEKTDVNTDDGLEVDILRAEQHGHMTRQVAIEALEGIKWCRKANRG